MFEGYLTHVNSVNAAPVSSLKSDQTKTKPVKLVTVIQILKQHKQQQHNLLFCFPFAFGAWALVKVGTNPDPRCQSDA